MRTKSSTFLRTKMISKKFEKNVVLGKIKIFLCLYGLRYWCLYGVECLLLMDADISCCSQCARRNDLQSIKQLLLMHLHGIILYAD